MYLGKRKSGISLVGDLPWGSNFCHFYQTKKDLLEILGPYVKAGLENNEFCLWVVAEPLTEDSAREALEKAVPGFGEYAKKGQIEIISCKGWGACGSECGKAIVSKLEKAISSGFDGVRFACNEWPQTERGRDFSWYNTDAISKYNVIAALAYARDKVDAIGLMDVIRKHRFALVSNAGKWEIIESSEARVVNDALKRSEEKLYSLFSNMSEGFAYHRVVTDAQGKPCDYVFIEINESFERLTGLKRENIVGKKATQVFPGIDKDPSNWIARYGHIALTGKSAQFESYSEALKKWYSVSAFSPHKGYFAVTFSDISERKRAEASIRQQNSVLEGINRLFIKALECQTEEELGRVCLAIAEEITESKAGFIGEINSQGRLDDIAISDPGWEACSMAIPNGHTGYRVVPTSLEIHGLYGRVMLDGKGFFTNDPCLHPDSIGLPTGHPPLACFLGVPLIQGNKVIGMVGLANRKGGYCQEQLDTMEALAGAISQVLMRHKAEQSLRQNRQLLAVTLESIGDGVIVTDIQGNVTFINGEAERLTGWKNADAQGKKLAKIFNIVNDHTRQPVENPVDKVLRLGTVVGLANHTILIAKDGVETPIDDSGAPIRDADGNVHGVVLVFRDFTEQKLAELALQKLNESLEFRVTERTAMAEQRSNQLRALAAELTMAEQNERKRLAHVLHDHLQQILAAAKLKASIVKMGINEDPLSNSMGEIVDLLTQSIQCSRNLSTELSPIVLNEGGLTAGLKWLINWFGQNHSLTVHLNSVTEIKNEIPESIKHFVFNAAREMLFNVCKHAGVNEAEIILTCSNGVLSLTIIDHGIGIDPSLIGCKGTGFGLFSIQERIQLLGGNVVFEGKLGKGTTILMTIPIHLEQSVVSGDIKQLSTEGSSKDSLASDLSKKIRVLIADDHHVMRAGLATMLSHQADIEIVAQASDGHSAITLASQYRPDVVILDVSMPKLSGVEAAKEISQKFPGIGIIGLSMHAAQDMEQAMIQAGAVAYCTKDGPPEILLQTIRSAVRV